MRYTSKSCTPHADAKARKSIDLIAAEYATAKTPFIPEGKSAAEILLNADRIGFDPKSFVYAQRRKSAQEMADAKKPFIEAEKTAEHLLKAAQAIRSHSPPPMDIPADLAAHTRTVILGAKAGILDSASIAEQIESSARIGLRNIAEARKAFRRFESAAATANANLAAKYYRNFPSAGLQKAADVLEAKAERLKHLHRLRFSNMTKAQRNRLKRSKPNV